MNERYDIAIVGTGPAGLSAALNAKIRKKKFILFGYENLSNKIIKAPKINNYLGLHGKTGSDVMKDFKAHIESMDIQITTERVNSIYAMGDYFALMVGEKTYEATSVILATGMEYTKPLKGEEEFLGRGVGYCATCDAPLYKGKKVSIIGYNKEAEEEASFVSEIADEVIYVPMYKGQYNLNDKVKIVEGKPIEIKGENHVTTLKLDKEEITTDGVFLLKDAISPGQLVPGLQMLEGHIEVDRLMKTNIKGCFACGDCVGKPYQYIKAAGEGNIAALSAVAYLEEVKNNS